MSAPTETPQRPCEADFRDTAAVDRARKVLAGEEISPSEALRLAKALRNELAFGLAREIASRHRDKSKTDERTQYELLRVEVTSTYKDLSLPAEESLPSARQTLVDAGYDPQVATDPEMLSLAAAIEKRWWDFNGDVSHLDKALALYTRAFGGDEITADGYPAINAAFLLDLMASLDARVVRSLFEGVDDPRCARARQIRTVLVDRLPRLAQEPGRADLVGQWWFEATIAESLWGLKRYDAAAQRLAKARSQVPDWELESALRQLASLTRVQQTLEDREGPLEESPGWQALSAAFGESLAAGIQSAFVGKIGLALSGGGFRASLYHVGVLARLAELDLLRHVEVLSCVSGGSIVGAYLYLELRHLLQKRHDTAISRDDYVGIVRRMEKHFLHGVQTNIRTQLLSELGSALKKVLSDRYSQTERLGELYEEVLYSKIADGEGAGPRWLNKLYIEPAQGGGANAAEERPPFNPRLQNWRRACKVPIVVLNATTLNTGHPWQFTASFMGEPPGGADPRFDANRRLRRVPYQDAPKQYRCIRLGHAVAASACVPGLFEPLSLRGLYEDDILVQLVDGGVCDNQGVASLLEQGCSVLWVSDASGQMPLSQSPASDRLGVFLRSNETLMTRVREVQYRWLESRRAASVLRGASYLHLKQGLHAEPVDWRGCSRPRPGGRHTPLTPAGVRTDVQARLAAIRTDLDAFHDFEAWSLMESGYKAASLHIPGSIPVHLGGHPPVDWTFHKVSQYVSSLGRNPDDYDAMCRLLDVGQAQAFKLAALYPRLQAVVRGLGAAVVVLGLGGLTYRFGWRGLVTALVRGSALAAPPLGWAALLASLAVGLLFGWRWLSGALGRRGRAPGRKAFSQRLGALGLLALAPLAKAYLKWGNPRYLAAGSLEGEAFLKTLHT